MTHDLDQTIRQRRSVRGFFPDRAVPPEVIRECLELAQRAPSNCNVQPWQVYVASGAARDQLKASLVKAIQEGHLPDAEDGSAKFIGDHRRLQIDCAVSLYKEMGIARDDQAGRIQAFTRNFEFFDAPHVAIVCMDRSYGVRVALDVGAWLQTFLLALWSRGVASVPQASLCTYPGIVRRELGIPDEQRILCGVSFGFEDPSVPANRTRQTREPLERNVRFVESAVAPD
ncbi:MAG TPA: nitroreductase [Pirellulales bacterium]|jgi:hypothetical protein